MVVSDYFIYATLGLAGVTGVLLLINLVGITCTHCGYHAQRLAWWLTRPLLFVLSATTLVFFILTAAFAGAPVFSSDVCASDVMTPQEVLYDVTVRSSSPFVDLFRYYSFCDTTAPAFYDSFVDAAIDDVNSVVAVLQDANDEFVLQIQEHQSAYDDYRDEQAPKVVAELNIEACSAISPIVTEVEILSAQLGEQIAAAADTFSCDELSHVYNQLLKEMACNSLAAAICWSFFSGACLVFAVLLMNTTRRGLLNDNLADAPPCPRAGRTARTSPTPGRRKTTHARLCTPIASTSVPRSCTTTQSRTRTTLTRFDNSTNSL